MVAAHERVPEVAAAVLAALASRPKGLPVDEVAQAIGEEPYVTGLACRHLRRVGQAAWDRVPGSRQWRVCLLETPLAPPLSPPVCFRSFAREMGIRWSEVRFLQPDQVTA